MDTFVQYFWVVSNSELSTAMHFAPPRGYSKAESCMKLYNPAGEVFNELTLGFPEGTPGTIEFDHLLSSCSLESGFRYACAEIVSPVGTGYTCRIISEKFSSIMGAARMLSNQQPGFFPKMFTANIDSFLCLINSSEVEVQVMVRVVAENRSPEIKCVIPPKGSRIVHVESAFEELATIGEEGFLPTYVRVRSRSEGSIGVQLLEHCKGGEIETFRTLT